MAIRLRVLIKFLTGSFLNRNLLEPEVICQIFSGNTDEQIFNSSDRNMANIIKFLFKLIVSWNISLLKLSIKYIPGK